MSDTDTHGIPSPDGIADVIETDYEIGQDNFETKIGPFGLDIHNPVFVISGAAIVVFVLYTLLLPEQASAAFKAMFNFTTTNFDWFLIGSADIVVIFALLLIVTPYGSVRLGGDEATPDYTYMGWFAMLFAAGMGIGLMFYGVSEPLTHFSTAFGGTAMEDGLRTDWAPLGAATGDEPGSVRLGMAATIYHWALHPWAIYATVALALALFTYNKGLPLTIRSAFYPILGDRVWGWPGHIIDIIAVFATLFGLATSLGFGATQANAGLNELFGVPIGNTTEVILISIITAVALVSVLRGLDGGVKVLSEINMGLAGLLALFTLIIGPTTFLITFFWDSLKAYVEYLPALSNPFGREDVNYSQGWTAFYWAWWISWSPFVGMFIARVSRGRTVREFVVCVLLIPSMVCVLWMSIFGGTAIHQVLYDGYTGAQDADLPLQLFRMLDQLPLASITSFIGIVLVVVFFVTSSDSGSLVIDTITAGGKVDAPVPQRVFWCIFEGAVAIALLLGGGLAALQSMVISTGLLFTVVLLVMCWCIFRGLQSERANMR
ncbi:BCCT family transporter [Sulfitobacter pseudonitzschiae]|uniref:BCCT family transporter n=1 Tax=Pseudosulfitobacter pseudonitzschiae TaxID=1402135 RepID=A0A9Q2RUA1_9RHOB|nr:BCCT family transporter [Pseudosulfitobacter pseudonitzschiae]MBM2290924.1 BCCT family transporter [Pseudosulfitobacter pseudonitzschiae]MBM2295842.1 BCCT family transporter [Pseudosulfitobacter pseudonitzschiae]MBM2300755.1 BCCT family transporter [Pseudosulfitobacter pseudonitzschiae]MBM2310539.1 BCCT family transporter [Pseudosulfitobacter pseudonitzschiae]MBM2315452.1 BCCT family transporter [Pseudosulfitobacter pseudonitzschiae]|tara:strand:+ start:875 stop:2515 length:1641 start_codon:yes stop_codon:yes gene_type:complete